MRKKRTTTALFLVAASILFPSLAQAAARAVTLVGVSGPGGARFADQLERDLYELYEVVSGDVYRAAAERLDKRGASPEEVQAVSAHLRIDAVIGGSIVGTGAARRLLVAVRDGHTGRVIARGRYDLSGRTLPLIREHVVADLVRTLERIGTGAAAVPVENEPVSPDTQPDTGLERNDTVTIVKHPPRPETASHGLSAGVGVSLLTRSLSFDEPTAPSFRGGTVGGIRAHARVFPLALSAELAEAHPVLASFGFTGSYEHVFGFTSITATGDRSAGHASRWDVLFLGRIPLGHGAVGGVLQLETGFQQLAWGHAAPADVGVPDVAYDLVDAGLSWERALGTRYAVLSIRVAYLAPVGEGPLTSATEYGRAAGGGVELGGGLTVWPTRWLWLELDARYSRIELSFAGAGQRFAHHASEQWAGGALEVGFAL